MNDPGYPGFRPGLGRILARAEEILTVPRLDRRLVPYRPAWRIVANVAPGVELVLPIFRPLAVHVMGSALPGRGRREENHIAMMGQRIQQGIGILGFDMLSGLEADDQIEALADVHEPIEIAIFNQSFRYKEH